MAMVTPEQPPQMQELLPLSEIINCPAVSGDDALQLQQNQEKARRHFYLDRDWIRRTIAASYDESEALKCVPFEPAGTIKVRFLEATPMTPRLIQIEDDDEE